MNRSDVSVLPPAPSLVRSLRAGFDAVANHVLLIAFPLILDLFLWFGPRLRFSWLINNFAAQLIDVYKTQDPALLETLRTAREFWASTGAQFNLLTALRSYPVGVPSLLVASQPMAGPLGQPPVLEIFSVGGVFLAWLALGLAGLILGSLYFACIADASLLGKLEFRQILSRWPRAALQMIGLALTWTIIIFMLTIPASILLSVGLVGGTSLWQCALPIYGLFVLWLILPLMFAPHGVFVRQYNFFDSIRASARLVRRTLPSTVLFLGAAFLIAKALDLLWLVPEETSWLLVVGILGHAFVATSLLAASFVFYRDADRWTRQGI